MALAGDGRFKHQPVDLEPGDIEIEIGQDAIIIGRQHLRQAQHAHLGGKQIFGGEAFAHQIERPPIDRQRRNFDKHALGIGYLDVMNDCLAENRAVDPPGLDHHSRLKLVAGQLPHDEGPAVVGIEPAHPAIGDDRQQQHAEHNDRQHPRHAMTAGHAGETSPGRAGSSGGGGFGHG